MLIKKYRFVTCFKELNSNIIHSEFSKNLNVDLDIAKELVANRLDFTENKMHYLLIDYSNTQQITPEAKDYMQRSDSGLKNILGAAFIASNPVAVLMANIFLKTQTDFPVKFFTDKTDANNWLKKLEKDGFSKQ